VRRIQLAIRSIKKDVDGPHRLGRQEVVRQKLYMLERLFTGYCQGRMQNISDEEWHFSCLDNYSAIPNDHLCSLYYGDDRFPESIFTPNNDVVKS
jgi:hypothetical protein